MKRNVVIVLALAWALSGCSLAPFDAAQQALMGDEPEAAADQRLADLGHAALSNGNYGLAEAYLEAALETNPNNPYALHNLGVVYYQTNRTDKARELYAKLIAFDPTDAVTAPRRNTAAEPPSEGAPAAAGDPIEVVRIDPVAPTVAPTVAPPAVGPPAFASAAVAASRIESKPQSTVLERFATLARLRDAGLINPAEYAERRGANLGALTPLTGPAPSAMLTRPPPPAEDVIGRLRTIGAFRVAGALSDAEFAAERIAILDALMPATGGDAPFAAPVPDTVATPARGRAPVDDLIERTAMMELAGPATPATANIGVSVDIDAIVVEPIPPPPEMQPKMAAAVPETPEMHEGPTFGVHIASYRSPERARRGWDVLHDAHGDVFGDLEPSIARVDLGPVRGVFYRLRAGPLADEAAADALCRELKRRDLYCAPSVF